MNGFKLLIFMGTCIVLIINNILVNSLKYKATRKDKNKGVNK